MIKQFKLGAISWKVEIANDRLDDLGLLGLCEHTKALISVYDKVKSKEMLDQTLYHEVVHAILHTLDRHDLSKDESFVQSFSLLLHQFEKTKK